MPNDGLIHLPFDQTDKSLGELLSECQQQIARYLVDSCEESRSCAEIVKRASQGDDDALAALLELSANTIRQKSPAALHGELDDVVQNVHLRLVRKFRNQESPYHATTYAAFVTYLNLTIRSVTINMLRRVQQPDSLEQMRKESGFEPKVSSPASMVEERMLLQRILLLLPDPLEREALRRRYTLRESPDEIVESLRSISSDINKQQVYRLIERGMRRLVNHPEVQEMRQEWL